MCGGWVRRSRGDPLGLAVGPFIVKLSIDDETLIVLTGSGIELGDRRCAEDERTSSVDAPADETDALRASSILRKKTPCDAPFRERHAAMKPTSITQSSVCRRLGIRSTYRIGRGSAEVALDSREGLYGAA